MATPRGAEHRDIEQRLRDIEHRVAGLSSRVLTQRKAEVSQGDFVVKGGGNIVILDADGNTVWSALDGPIRAENLASDVDSTTMPNDTTWREYAAQNLTVPAGFTSAIVAMYATTGNTWSGSGGGILGVQPAIDFDPAGPSALANGPGVTNGTTGAIPCSVSSYFGTTLTGLTGGQVLKFSTLAYSSGAASAGAANVHITATALFLR